MSVSTLNTYRDAAVAAIAGGDYATALGNLRAAQTLLATMPDARAAENSLNWDREAIARAITDCQRAIGAAAGIQRSKVTYSRPTT